MRYFLNSRNNFLDSVFDDDFYYDMNMKVDVKKEKDNYIINADLPGFKKEDINLDLEDGYLTIKAFKSEEVNEEEDNYVRKERHSGSYSRSFYVGDINETDIKAKYDNGVLSIVIPANDEKIETSKKIEIE